MGLNNEIKHLDLFSGIGGFSLAAQQVWGEDHKIHSFVETDQFCQKVLKKHWPDVSIISDIKEYNHNGTAIDLLTGGFPCQPFSCAGKQRGKEDDRYLWPEMLRVISEVRPTWIIGENVAGIINMGLDQALSDLENEGYTCQPFVIPACAINAPHRRDRVWIVANSGRFSKRGPHQSKQTSNHITGCDSRENTGSKGNVEDVADSNQLNGNNAGYGSDEVSQFEKTEVCELQTSSNAQKTERKSSRRTRAGRERPANGDRFAPNSDDSTSTRQRRNSREILSITESARFDNNAWQEPWLEVATRLCRVDNGLPRRMDRVNRLKALGNAIVPQVVVPIMQAIKELK